MRIPHIILLIFTTLLLTNAFSQVTDPITQKSDRIRANERRNNVKSIRTYAHSVDANGKTSRKGELISEVFFNERGLNVKTRNWINNSLMTHEYEYNDQGKQVKKVMKANGNLMQTIESEYDSNGKLIETRTYKADGTLSSVNDLRKQPENTETETYNTKGEVISKAESRYDSTTRTFTSRVMDGAGKLKYENNYRLDEKGTLLEWWMIDDAQTKRSSIKFSYDEHGNELESQMFKADGTPKEKNVSLYNERGLKIENARYDSSNTKIEVMRYEYEYYDK